VIGKPRVVDGLGLLKNGSSLDPSDSVSACTHGEWSKREKEISKVLGEKIHEITNAVPDLHFLQRLRNSIAHDFARTAKKKDFWYIDPELANPQPVELVTAKRVQELLRTVSLVAEKLEAATRPHIGCFELMLFWHQFEIEKVAPRNQVIKQYVKLYKEGSHSKLLSTYHHKLVGGALGREYCDALIRYYYSS
jgi:hypothetical protein